MPKDGKIRPALDFKNVSTVVFDIGDTLFDTTGLMQAALQRTANLMKRSHFVGNPSQFCRTYLKIDRQVSGPTVNHLFSGLEILERVWAALELTPSPAALGTFLGAYRDFVRKGIHRDDRLIAVFKKLRQTGRRVAILTDGSTEEQLEQLVRLGIVKYLDLIVTSQQVGVEKPDRQIFDFLLSSLAVRAGESVMVGNDIERDILGAKAVGMRTILVTAYSPRSKKQSKAPADFVVKHVNSVAEVLLD